MNVCRGIKSINVVYLTWVYTPGNVISYKLWLSVHTCRIVVYICRIILHICRMILHKRRGSYMYGQYPTYPAINHTYLSYHSYILRHIIHTYLSYHVHTRLSSYISVISFIHTPSHHSCISVASSYLLRLSSYILRLSSYILRLSSFIYGYHC